MVAGATRDRRRHVGFPAAFRRPPPAHRATPAGVARDARRAWHRAAVRPARSAAAAGSGQRARHAARTGETMTGPGSMPDDSAVQVALSLISHTNTGKTALARTLLARDVGEVRDAPHVTATAERYVMIESAAGDALLLWDTPGFGDSARLARRLAVLDQPILGFLAMAWDRWRDRAFW